MKSLLGIAQLADSAYRALPFPLRIDVRVPSGFSEFFPMTPDRNLRGALYRELEKEEEDNTTRLAVV